MIISIIFSLFVILFLIIFIIKKFRSRGSLKNMLNKHPYSWFEILNPFNKAPFKVYGKLSPEKKASVWSVVGSIIIGIVTCWLGFTIQYMIADKYELEKSKVIHYQIVDKITPMYETFLDSCNYAGVVDTLSYYTNISLDDKDSIPYGLHLYFENPQNWPNIVHAASSTIPLMSKALIYMNSKQQNEARLNNTKIKIGVKLYEGIKNSDVGDSLTFVTQMMKEFSSMRSKISIGHNSNYKDICADAYSLIKSTHDLDLDESLAPLLAEYDSLKDLNDSSNTLHPDSTLLLKEKLEIDSLTIELSKVVKNKSLSPVMKKLFSEFLMQPMINNLMLINQEIIPIEKNTEKELAIKSLGILFIGILFGYIIFRIILLYFFGQIAEEYQNRKNQQVDKPNRIEVVGFDDLKKMMTQQSEDKESHSIENENLINRISDIEELLNKLKLNDAELKSAMEEIQIMKKDFEALKSEYNVNDNVSHKLNKSEDNV